MVEKICNEMKQGVDVEEEDFGFDLVFSDSR